MHLLQLHAKVHALIRLLCAAECKHRVKGIPDSRKIGGKDSKMREMEAKAKGSDPVPRR